MLEDEPHKGADGRLTPYGIELLINKKHKEYVILSRTYMVMYYTTRSVVVIGASLLPLFASSDKHILVPLSIIVAIATAVDTVFSPKDKLALYANASDILTIARLKSRGEYYGHEELIEAIFTTEAAALRRLSGLSELLHQF